MPTHGPQALLMRRHVPHHEVGVIRARHAEFTLVRKGHSIHTANMAPETAVQPEPLESAWGSTYAPADGLVRDTWTLLPPEKQVESEGVVPVVLGWRRRRRVNVGWGSLNHGLGWTVGWWCSSAT